jgi:hypothetical protein
MIFSYIVLYLKCLYVDIWSLTIQASSRLKRSANHLWNNNDVCRKKFGEWSPFNAFTLIGGIFKFGVFSNRKKRHNNGNNTFSRIFIRRILQLIVLYLKCLYVDIWSNKSIYLSNKIKHLKWFTKYRVNTICDGRTDGQRQRVNIRKNQESCNILRKKRHNNGNNTFSRIFIRRILQLSWFFLIFTLCRCPSVRPSQIVFTLYFVNHFRCFILLDR